MAVGGSDSGKTFSFSFLSIFHRGALHYLEIQVSYIFIKETFLNRMAKLVSAISFYFTFGHLRLNNVF